LNPETLREAIQAAGGASLSAASNGSVRLSRLLRGVFGRLGGPVALEQLVTAIADSSEIRDRSVPILDDTLATTHPWCCGSAAHPAITIEHRSHLARTWSEITQLPPNQRAALLLNLRDAAGNDALALFHLTGVASFAQIAELLDLSPRELADLSDDLPLPDAVIARRLGVERQQVINFRKSARERLARRLKRIPSKKGTEPVPLPYVSLS
jgi:hypothetical protein